MRRLAVLVGSTLAACWPVPAFAWLVYPDRDRPERIIVEIERSYGDVLALASLPAPFDTAFQSAQGPDRFSFRWRYDRDAQGLAFLRVDETGNGAMEFRFADRRFSPGGRLGAAVVLVGNDGQPLHTFYARSEVNPRPGPRGSGIYSAVRLDLSRPPGWWRGVDRMAFFYMSYDPSQKLTEEGVWRAMRRAVERFTRGYGSAQRG